MDKQDIINIALKLYYEKGFNATSMEDIANELDVKKASLYYHIESKQKLLYDMIENIGIKLFNEIEAIELSNKSSFEKLRCAIHTHTITILKNIEYTALVHDEIKSLDPEQRKYIEVIQEKYLQIFKDILKEGILAGFIVDMDVSILTHIVLGTCTWGYKWFKQSEKFTPEEVADLVCDFVMRAICRDEV